MAIGFLVLIYNKNYPYRVKTFRAIREKIFLGGDIGLNLKTCTIGFLVIAAD